MDSRRLSINLISNIVQFAASLIISFFFTPYIVSSVGEEAYSFYILAGQFISYITVFTAALNSMASRYITIEWHKGNKQKVEEYFSSVFYASAAVSTLLAILVALFVGLFIDKVINIPTELLSSVKLLFALVLGAGLIQTTLSVFDSATFCRNRIHLKSFVLIISSVMKIAILLALFGFGGVWIVDLGIAYLSCALFENLMNVFFTRKLMKEIRIRPRSVRIASIRELLSVGVWNAVNQVNTILLNSVDVLLANLLVSVALSGILGIAKTVPNLLMTLAVTVSGIFIPGITIAYAKEDKIGLQKAFKQSFKIVNFGLTLITAGYIVFGREFYALWMPTVDSSLLYHTSLLSMMALPIVVSTQTSGNVALLTKKLKLPVLLTMGRGVLGVLLMIFLAKFTKLGIYALAGTQSVLTILYDLFFSVPYTAYCIRYKKRFFYLEKLKAVAVIGLYCLLFGLVKSFAKPTGWPVLAAEIAVCVLIGGILNLVFYKPSGIRELKDAAYSENETVAE